MSLLLTRDVSPTPGIRRRTLSQKVEVGAVTLVFVVLALALVVSLIYLAHANRVATRGYVIKKLEVEKNAITTDNEILAQSVSEAKSLEAIRNSPAVKKMQVVSDAAYVKTETAVAKR